MKKLFFLFAFSLVAATASAHPGVGIVCDTRGNIFYTDLKQVWKIAPDGKKTVAVPNVHTHELALDAADNLYGEHLWYEGEATNKWGYRVWCLKRDGGLSDIIPARAGFLDNYSFVRDGAGNMYWAARGAQTVIKKRAPDGTITTHATADFRDVRWMTATADGTLFLIDQGDLRRVSPAGQVTKLAGKLSERQPATGRASTRHYQQGLWTDAGGNVFVAVSEERLVLRVQPDGKMTTAARSPLLWSPSGGLSDGDGNLWLLEYSMTNAVRVRRIDRHGAVRVF